MITADDSGGKDSDTALANSRTYMKSARQPR